MITKVRTIEELRQMISELALAKTDKITKVSPGSVVDGFFSGIAKVSQKAFKDIAIVESHLFPEYAFGDSLDTIAERMGVLARLGSCESSTYVRLVGEEGTQYSSSVHRFIGAQGLIFELEEDIEIGSIGYSYAKIKSIEKGEKTNCGPNTINKVIPVPSGHLMVTNEYRCEGGRDIESDIFFRMRIRDFLNSISMKTLAYYTQVLMKVNSNVLRVYKRSINDYGKNVLIVVSHNGIDFSTNDLIEMEEYLSDYLSLYDLRDFGGRTFGISLENPSWKNIDCEFRVDLKPNVDLQKVRIDIQTKFSKYVDYRFWNYGEMVEWDDLLGIVKGVNGVNYVPDVYFSPRIDISVGINELPRFRGFIMRNMVGELLVNTEDKVNPIYYPREKSILII